MMNPANDTSDTSSAVGGAPSRRIVRRRGTRPDQNRTLEVASGLVLYIIVVHFALKFASFLIPEDDEIPTREDVLRVRGAGGVMGFSLDTVRRKSPLERNSDMMEDILVGIHSTKDDHAEEEVVSSQQSTNSTIHKRARIPILSYQDKYVIVSKPSGMAMHNNANTHSRWGRSKSSLVLEKAIKRQLGRKPYLVHRLDHRTSGACILGFDSSTAAELHSRLRDKDATKLYVALVRGDLREKFQCAGDCTTGDTVDLSIDGVGSVIGSRGSIPNIKGKEGEVTNTYKTTKGRSSEHSGKITVNLSIKVNEVEKESQTDFYFLSSLSMEEEQVSSAVNTANTPYMTKSLTLLLCQPRTGRTHQIRRHVRKAFNSPVIGDSEHGDSRVNRYWRTNIGFDRLGLHCFYLKLPPSSEDDNNIECMAPLHNDFSSALNHEMLQPLWEEAVSAEPLLLSEPYDERGGSFGRSKESRQVL